jgi:hypothetical protein
VLCEMMLDDPEKFRLNMKDQEDQHHWVKHLVKWPSLEMVRLLIVLQRVDPIGYDAQLNTYWLFDGMCLTNGDSQATQLLY